MRKELVFASVSGLGILLGSCAQYEAERQQEAYSQEMANRQAADAKCQSYGVAPGTPGYVQCRINLDNQAAADQQQRNAIAAQLLLRR